MTEPMIYGVDGCKGGWIVVTSGLTSGPTTISFSQSLKSHVQAVRDGLAGALAVDMPIGLPDSTKRLSDFEARRLLGPRRSTIFPTPARSTLLAHTYEEAQTASRASLGVGLSKQAFHLLPKIRELDALLLPTDQPAVSEAHPELSFAAMAGYVLDAKTSISGVGQRFAALLRHFPDLLETVSVAPSAGKLDDVLDAFAMAWTARRIVSGQAHVIGDASVRDSSDMAMVVMV